MILFPALHLALCFADITNRDCEYGTCTEWRFRIEQRLVI